jgi:hypothetical protein
MDSGSYGQRQSRREERKEEEKEREGSDVSKHNS